LRAVVEERGWVPAALLRQRAARLGHICAFIPAQLYVFLDLVQLSFRVDGPDVGVLIERIPDAQRLDAVLQFADDNVRHGFLHEQARARTADVPLVEEDAVDDPFHGLVERCIVKNEMRCFTAQLQRKIFICAGRFLLDKLADFRGAREGEFADVGMLNK